MDSNKVKHQVTKTVNRYEFPLGEGNGANLIILLSL